MSQKEAISYWKKTAEETRVAARDNYAGAHADWSFFLWHLAIEKALKGLIIKKGDVPLPIHNLVQLAKSASMSITAEQKAELKEITSYAIDARYDDYKRNFYKKVSDRKYAEKWQFLCGEIYLWLIKQF